MTRGRRSVVALGEAVLIAKKRGETRQFMHGPDMICNFVIYCIGFIAHVRIKRVRRLRCSHAEIEREAAEALVTLRSIASASGISRELWIFLPHGLFRFFRVTETGLIELDRDGSVLVVPEKNGPATVPPVSAADDTVLSLELPDLAPVREPPPLPASGQISRSPDAPVSFGSADAPGSLSGDQSHVGERTPDQGRDPGEPTR